MVEVVLGVEDLAKYPFLQEAGELVRELGLSINDLAESDYANVLARAKERILQAAMKGSVSHEILEPRIELLSFPLALVLVKATGLDYLSSKCSHAEAVRVERLLEEERNPEMIAYIFGNVLNIDLQRIPSSSFGYGQFDFKIPLSDYLARATQLHSLGWKLINRVVERGYLYLRKHDLIRLIREEIRRIIYGRIRTLLVPKLPPNLELAAKEIAQSAPAPIKSERTMEIPPEKYPPCVVHALDLLKKGESVPHFGRFLMTTYLLSVGKSVDEIIQLYPRSPDFNERITRYQVEHIAGLRGGRTRYKVPVCRTLQTHSFCFKIDACDNIKSPLQFGRRLQPSKKEKGR